MLPARQGRGQRLAGSSTSPRHPPTSTFPHLPHVLPVLPGFQAAVAQQLPSQPRTLVRHKVALGVAVGGLARDASLLLLRPEAAAVSPGGGGGDARAREARGSEARGSHASWSRVSSSHRPALECPRQAASAQVSGGLPRLPARPGMLICPSSPATPHRKLGQVQRQVGAGAVRLRVLVELEPAAQAAVERAGPLWEAGDGAQPRASPAQAHPGWPPPQGAGTEHPAAHLRRARGLAPRVQHRLQEGQAVVALAALLRVAGRLPLGMLPQVLYGAPQGGQPPPCRALCQRCGQASKAGVAHMDSQP
jgi:hypothetical protein